MSKFSKVLETQIKNRAEKQYEVFWKEFESLLNKYNLPRDVIFRGLKGHFEKKEDNGGDGWQKRVFEVFEKTETEKFILQLCRQWRKWAMTLLQQEPGISAERRERWIKLANTPWDELSEDWKEHDRQWARHVLRECKLQFEEDHVAYYGEGIEP